MEELELFKRKVASYIEKAYTGGISLLMFLDEAKISLLEEQVQKNPMIQVRYEGGFIHSDRVRAMVCPFDSKMEDFKITLYQIKYNKRFYTLNHRSILGSLMSLGIKRECIGDIYISDNQDAFFACCKEMGDYIVQNFHFVGNVSIELEEIQEKIEEVIHYERNVYFVSSLRLDVIIAAAYHFSRKEALDYISNGMVFIKHVLIQNPSHIVKCGDEISVRHKGRFLFEKIGGESKSGRIAVTLAKRV